MVIAVWSCLINPQEYRQLGDDTAVLTLRALAVLRGRFPGRQFRRHHLFRRRPGAALVDGAAGGVLRRVLGVQRDLLSGGLCRR